MPQPVGQQVVRGAEIEDSEIRLYVSPRHKGINLENLEDSSDSYMQTRGYYEML